MSSMSLLLLIVIGGVVNAQLKRILLPKNTTGGQCMDGSPAGLFYSPPPSGSSNLWVITIKGGGLCNTKKSCDQRATTASGSSNYWPATEQFHEFGELQNDPSINPDFYMGHKILCYYCTSDCWQGQRTEASSDPDTWGYIFDGHLVFTQIIEYAETNLGLLDAEYVLLTGASAGGIGLFANVDWLASHFKQKGYKNLTFKGSPKAGWGFSGNTTDQPNDPMMPPNDYPHWDAHQTGGVGHNNSVGVLYDGYLNPKCVNDLGPNEAWHCGSVHNLYKYIETPLFVMQNKFDYAQIYGQFKLPHQTVNNDTTGYVEYFGVDTDRSIITQMIDEKNEKNGVFYASCFDHGDGLGIGNNQTLTKINGYNSSQLAGDWFWERNKLPHLVYDQCNNDTYKLPCNPTCDPYPPN